MKKLVGLIFLFQCAFLLTIEAQNNTIQKDKWHWDDPLKQDTSAGYVQVVKVDNVLYISGAVALDVTPEGITSVYRALEKSLKSYGATFQNVVKENLYTTDMEAMKRYNDARNGWSSVIENSKRKPEYSAYSGYFTIGTGRRGRQSRRN